ncbi:MAG: hypothetical protein H6814_00040 [Phycisphaeraceae bacterium]|nr:hypothetical protein [Phycisphaeraceae bacterium]
MPATRSRTDNWRRSLEQIHARNGALEITLPRETGPGDEDDAWQNLVWRVRILDLTDNEIVVERPSALGVPMDLHDGVKLVAVMPIGQNRWMFHTQMLGATTTTINHRQSVEGIRLRMPRTVERCQRRNFYRMSTAGLVVPNATCRPLLDIASAPAAEHANRTRIQMLLEGQLAGVIHEDEHTMLPEVGPPFPAKLINIGGGGAGLLVEPEDAKGLHSHPHFWVQIDLSPMVSAPIGLVGRLAHTHIDSQQRVYAGFAFEFNHDQTHRKFVIDLLCKYVNDLQRRQLHRESERA